MEFIAMIARNRQSNSKSKTVEWIVSRDSAATTSVTPSTVADEPRFVGIDLHKEIAVYHIISKEGVSIEEGKFLVKPDRILEFAAERLKPVDRVAIEATTNTWAFIRMIRPYVDMIVVSNPLKTKAIAEANIKTDKVDALVLAQLLRCDFLPGVWQPGPAAEHNRSLAARRTALVGQRTAIRNRIHAVLAQRLVAPPATGLFSTSGLAWLKNLELDPLGRALVESDLRLLTSLDQEFDVIDNMIIQECYEDPDIKLLMTMPGIDYTTAHALKATIADVDRFPDPDKAASYLGLVPSVKQSAAKRHTGPITKAGSSQARWLMVQAAQSVGKHPGPLGAFFRKLAKRKNRNVAVVATARKMVTIAWHMLKNKEPYRYATSRCTDEKMARLRVRATGEKRKGGITKGAKRESKLGSGQTRTIKSLDEVYARQGLPPRGSLSEGERKMIEESGTQEFVKSLDTEHVIPKKRKQTAEIAVDAD